MSLSTFESKFRRLAELRQERDMDKTTADRSERAYRAYEAELMDEADSSSIRGTVTHDFGDDLGTVRFTFKKPTKYGTITDPHAAAQSLREMARYDEIFAPKVQGQRLNELVRELEDSGHELPEGIGKYEKRGITISHVRNK